MPDFNLGQAVVEEHPAEILFSEGFVLDVRVGRSNAGLTFLIIEIDSDGLRVIQGDLFHVLYNFKRIKFTENDHFIKL